MFIKKYESQYSGRRSLQIIFGMRQEVEYQFNGETFRDTVNASALLWLHFSDVESACLARGCAWWTKLTGMKDIFPKSVDEAFEMRGLIIKPSTVTYCVHAGRGTFYNTVIDVGYGEQGHPGVNEDLYREFNREMALQRANELMKQYKIVKHRMKLMMGQADADYDIAVQQAVSKYNEVVERVQADCDVAMALKKEADDLVASYDNVMSCNVVKEKSYSAELPDDAPF
jgi:hypothetical protein